MANEIDQLAALVKNGKMSRREFIAAVGALGLSVASAQTLLAAMPSSEAVTISMTDSAGPMTQPTEESIADFESEHPGIKIEYRPMAWEEMRPTTITEIQAGKPPDIMAATMDAWIAEYVSMGALYNLKDRFETLAYIDDYTDIALAAMDNAGVRTPDAVYGLVHTLGCRVQYYRKDWYEEAGLKPAETYEELLTNCQKLTDPAKNRYGFTIRGAIGCWFDIFSIIASLSSTQPYELFDEEGNCLLNTPEAVEAIEFYYELFKTCTPDSVNWAYQDSVSAFTSGLTSTLFQDPETVLYCEDVMEPEQWAVAPLPRGPKGLGYTWLLQLFHVIPEGAQHKDEAWEFISWFNDPIRKIPWLKVNKMVPEFKSAADDPFFATGTWPAFMDTISDTSKWLPAPYPFHLPEYGDFSTNFVTAENQKMLLGEQTPQQMADAMAALLTDAQKKYLAEHAG